MKTVSRVYDTYSQARNAVTAVEAAGVPTSEVSLVANKYVSEKYADVEEVSRPATGAGIGGVVGGGAGLLAGLGLLAIPGLGPVVAAGWLAATRRRRRRRRRHGRPGRARWLAPARSDSTPHVYSESVRRGGTLVSARVADGDAGRIQAILDRYKPIDAIGARRRVSQGGLEGFRPEGAALQAERERDRAHAPRGRAGLAGFLDDERNHRERAGSRWLPVFRLGGEPSGTADRCFMSDIPSRACHEEPAACQSEPRRRPPGPHRRHHLHRRDGDPGALFRPGGPDPGRRRRSLRLHPGSGRQPAAPAAAAAPRRRRWWCWAPWPPSAC